MASCKIDINDLPVLDTCPPDSAQVLLFNLPTSTYPNGMGLMPLSALLCCFLNKSFGAGTLTIKGSDLVGGFYYNANLVQNLRVYAWNIPNYLIREGQNGLDPGVGQWRYVMNGGVVAGVEIYGVNYNDDDLFTIFPDASCVGMPSTLFNNEINETEEFRAVATGRIMWDERRRSKYGRSGSFVVFIDDGTGKYLETSVQGFPDNIDNPNYYDFDFGGVANANIIVS